MISALREAFRSGLYVQVIRLVESSRFLGRRGNWNEELDVVNLGVISAERAQDFTVGTWFRSWRAEILYYVGRWDEARVVHESVLSTARELSDKILQVYALNGLGRFSSQRGKFGDALSYFLQALPLSLGFENGRMQGMIEANLSEAYTGLGRYREALECGERALVRLRMVDDLYGAVYVQYKLARAWQGLNEHHTAIAVCRDVVAQGRTIGFLAETVADPLDALGISLNYIGRTAEALECWREAVAIFKDYGQPYRATQVQDRIELHEEASSNGA